jgi:hypothetical protein
VRACVMAKSKLPDDDAKRKGKRTKLQRQQEPAADVLPSPSPASALSSAGDTQRQHAASAPQHRALSPAIGLPSLNTLSSAQSRFQSPSPRGMLCVYGGALLCRILESDAVAYANALVFVCG